MVGQSQERLIHVSRAAPGHHVRYLEDGAIWPFVAFQTITARIKYENPDVEAASCCCLNSLLRRN